MEELNQDVNLEGQNLPPVVVPSSQEKNSNNIATQGDHGGVINDDPKDRDYKNKWVESDRKNQILEEKIKMQEALFTKFQPPAQQGSLSQLNKPETVQVDAGQDAELLRLTETDLNEIAEKSAEGRIQASKLRTARIEAYRRKVDQDNRTTEDRVYNRVKREINIKKIITQFPDLDVEGSVQNQAYLAEYRRMQADGRVGASTVEDAFVLAKAKNPTLFAGGNNIVATPETRRDSLAQHSVGRTAPGQAAQEDNVTLTKQEVDIANAFGNDHKRVAAKLKDIRQGRR